MKCLPALLGFIAVVLASIAGDSLYCSNAIIDDGAIAGRPPPVEVLGPLLEEYNVPGVSIAAIRGGRIDWAKGYGLRKKGGTDTVDYSTVFQAASISKVVTAVGALRLVEGGLFSLDDDINGVMKSWMLPENGLTINRPVTLRSLLSHSAGLNVHGFPGYTKDAELPNLVQILNGERPANTSAIRVAVAPGEEFRYSGGGYVVVQQLMTDVLASNFEEIMEKLVLMPAEMEDSTFHQLLPEELRSRAAVGHDWDGKPLQGSWHLYPEMGAAGLWTTAIDLAKFMIELWRSYYGVSNDLLSQDLTRKMFTRQIEEWGLGVILPRDDPFRFAHGGGNEGFRCFFTLSVGSGDGVVIMTNGNTGNGLIDEIVEMIDFRFFQG